MSFPAHTTPKRKRDDEADINLSPLKFSFDSSLGQDVRDGSNSPRSKVAHRFRGLGLHEGDVASGSGGGVGATESSQPQGDVEADQVAKRQRHDECMRDAEEPPRIVSDLIGLQPGDALGITGHHGKTVPQPASVRDEKLQHQREEESGDSNEPVPDLTGSVVLGKKRAGTPPLRIKKLSPKVQDTNNDVVDPVRAALTWHEDEITIYDPDDADDDGTGINGVGFKPTAAIAHARVMRRRQQLAEYKRREESDARARRNQKRRGAAQSQRGSLAAFSSPPSSQADAAAAAAAGEGDRSPRKVRFTDNEGSKVAITTK